MDFKRTRSHFHPRGPARRAPRQTSIGPKRTSWRSGWRAAPDGGDGGLGRAPVSQGAAARTYNPAHDDCHRLRRSTLDATRAGPGADRHVHDRAQSPVGCVIVRDGRVLGEGATQPPGGPHAEVCALRDAQARGETVAGATSMSRWSRAAITAAPRPAWTPCCRRAGARGGGDRRPQSPGQRPGPGAAARRRHRRHHRRLPRGSAGAQCGLHLPHESRAALGLDEDGGFAGWPQRVA